MANETKQHQGEAAKQSASRKSSDVAARRRVVKVAIAAVPAIMTLTAGKARATGGSQPSSPTS